MNQLPRCKYCKTLPVRGKLGNLYEVYCPEMDEQKCPQSPSVTGETKIHADHKWINKYGAK